MTSKLLVLAAFVLVACASNPGVSRFRSATPAPLVPREAARPPETVRLAMTSVPWWTVAEASDTFVLGFDESHAPPPVGRQVGEVRSSDVALDDDLLAAVRCAWKIIPMGDPRPCPSGMPRAAAMESAREPIAAARDDVRAQAARAGVGAVADVRCFVRESARPHLWCEGVAIADQRAPTVAPDEDPTAPIDHDPEVRPSRFLISADGGVGMLGTQTVVSSLLSLRYRPLEAGFELFDLARTSLAPTEGRRVGVGVTVLGRYGLGHSRFDAIVGGSAIATFQNGATNPTFAGLYHGFAGIAYQTPWRISGVAQPWVQLRAGAAYDRGTEAAAPMVGLHFGLSSPELR